MEACPGEETPLAAGGKEQSGEEAVTADETLECKEKPVDVCCVCGSDKEVKRCGGCKLTSYCSKRCQKQHITHHGKWCSAIADLQKIETDKLYQDKTVRQVQVDWKIQKKMVQLVGRKPMLSCQFDGKDVDALWDTGSMISLVSSAWMNENFPDSEIVSISQFLGDEKLSVKAANATEIDFDGVAIVLFTMGKEDEGFWVPMLVTSGELEEPILGYNVIEYLLLEGTTAQHEALRAAFKKKGGEDPIGALAALMQDPDYLTDIKVAETVHVPAGMRRRIRCRVKAQGNDDEQTVYFAPRDQEGDDELTFSESVCTLKRGRTNYVTVDVMNLTKKDKVLSKGTEIGSMHSVASVIPMVSMVNAQKVRTADVRCTSGTINDEGTITCECGDECKGRECENDGDIKWDLSHLNEEQRLKMEAVLKKHKHVFSKNDSDIGDITDFQMPIQLTDQVPVTASYRKIPPNLYKEVKNYIDDLVSNGWVKESFSSYSSPIVCVRKKSGQMRMCVDYRKLNAKTIPDCQPIPRIQDLLDSLGGSQWFSTLDMSKAYHQGYIEEKSRHLTAFVTPWTLLEFIRIPFGLRNAPPAFQRYMNQMLGDLKGAICEPYLDDVLCHSKTFDDHVADVDKVLERLGSKGIKLRAGKCVFGKQEVRYLGRLVSAEGYRPDPADTAALEKFRSPPGTVGELRSLLGFLGYYRCYVRDFSRKVKPLYNMLKEDTQEGVKGKKKVDGKMKAKQNSKAKIEWLPKHQEILEELISYLQSPEIIAFPDFSLPFFMHTDASNEGLGAVLMQRQGEKDRVISYGSRTLSDAERNYNLHSGKLEFLALKWAITERFSDYLIGGPHFTVYTDNNPLTYVLTTAKLNAVGMRWVNELADFDFTIKYRPGKENSDADYLSRRSMNMEDYRKSCGESLKGAEALRGIGSKVDVETVTVGAVSVRKLELDPDEEVVRVSLEELKQKQQNDEVVGPVYTAVIAGGRPKGKEWKELSRKSRILMKSFDKLSVVNGVLRRETAKYSQLVLPSEYHQLVFVELHEKMAHVGSDKVIDLAQQRYYWPLMSKDIEDHIRKKCRCVANKKPNVREKAPLVPVEATHPFEMVSIDYLQLDACKGNFKYIMVATDHFTRYCQLYATRTKSSKAAAEKLFNEFIPGYGHPERILHDQGGEFNSELFAELHRLTGIRSVNTTPYHPMSNGKAERLNRTVINMLKALPEIGKRDWKKHLPKLAFAYNSTINKSTGFSPFFLLFGRESRLPIDLAFQDTDVGTNVKRKTHQQFVEDWHNAMKEAVKLAQENAAKVAGYGKKHFDKKAKAVEISKGDRVLMQNVRERGGTGKLRSFWEETIFTVMEKRENLPVYKIQSLKNCKDVRVVHRNLLMKCDQLPDAVFDGPVSMLKPKKAVVSTPQKARKKKKSQKKGTDPVIDVSMSDEEEEGTMLVIEEVICSPQPEQVDVVDGVSSQELVHEVAVEREDSVSVVSDRDDSDSGMRILNPEAVSFSPGGVGSISSIAESEVLDDGEEEILEFDEPQTERVGQDHDESLDVVEDPFQGSADISEQSVLDDLDVSEGDPSNSEVEDENSEVENENSDVSIMSEAESVAGEPVRYSRRGRVPKEILSYDEKGNVVYVTLP